MREYIGIKACWKILYFIAVRYLSIVNDKITSAHLPPQLNFYYCLTFLSFQVFMSAREIRWYFFRSGIGNSVCGIVWLDISKKRRKLQCKKWIDRCGRTHKKSEKVVRPENLDTNSNQCHRSPLYVDIGYQFFNLSCQLDK